MVCEQGQSNTLASGVRWCVNKGKVTPLPQESVGGWTRGKQHPWLKSQMMDEQWRSNTLASRVSWWMNKGEATPLPQESVGGWTRGSNTLASGVRWWMNKGEATPLPKECWWMKKRWSAASNSTSWHAQVASGQLSNPASLGKWLLNLFMCVFCVILCFVVEFWSYSFVFEFFWYADSSWV